MLPTTPYKPIPFSSEISPGDVVAVGDIHGRADLLDLFLERVKDSGARVIFLGDLVDRGPDDLGVLERVRRLLDDPESHGLESVTALRGNHEQMVLDVADDVPGAIQNWAHNGANCHQANEILEHAEWIRQLPIYTTVGDTLFVHAGIEPGVNPAITNPLTLIWIREPFLTVGPQLDKWTTTIKRVVHGHTPFFENDQLGQVNVSRNGVRVGIDSGAYFTGVLTSYNATKNTLFQHKI